LSLAPRAASLQIADCRFNLAPFVGYHVARLRMRWIAEERHVIGLYFGSHEVELSVGQFLHQFGGKLICQLVLIGLCCPACVEVEIR